MAKAATIRNDNAFEHSNYVSTAVRRPATNLSCRSLRGVQNTAECDGAAFASAWTRTTLSRLFLSFSAEFGRSGLGSRAIVDWVRKIIVVSVLFFFKVRHSSRSWLQFNFWNCTTRWNVRSVEHVHFSRRTRLYFRIHRNTRIGT